MNKNQGSLLSAVHGIYAIIQLESLLSTYHIYLQFTVSYKQDVNVTGVFLPSAYWRNATILVYSLAPNNSPPSTYLFLDFLSDPPAPPPSPSILIWTTPPSRLSLLIFQILFCRYFRDCLNRLFYLRNCKQFS